MRHSVHRQDGRYIFSRWSEWERKSFTCRLCISTTSLDHSLRFEERVARWVMGSIPRGALDFSYDDSVWHRTDVLPNESLSSAREPYGSKCGQTCFREERIQTAI